MALQGGLTEDHWRRKGILREGDTGNTHMEVVPSKAEGTTTLGGIEFMKEDPKR